MQRHSLDLVLLKFSTGEYHPFAHDPLIHVQRSPSARPFVSIRTVGDNLTLVIHGQDGSKLFIFDWKTGHKQLEHSASEGAYEQSTAVFLSPELLLVPNHFLSHFEVWRLFPSPSPDPPVQILSLEIPTVAHDHSIISIRSHGEPNPFLHSMPYIPLRPFFHSSEDSIITVSLILESLPALQSAYRLIVHRRTLLNVIQKWTSDSTSSTSLGPTSSTSQHDFLEVRWADWGPPISRWLRLNRTDIWRTRRCHGQRYVFLDSDPGDSRKCRICVADFNLHNVRRNAEMMAQLRKEGEDNSNNGKNGEGKKEENDEELEILEHEGEFSEEVYMGLKCVVNHAPGEYDFDVVLMDEERLFGLKVDSIWQEKNIKVLYFG